MLLALAADTPQRKAQAVQRITSRLKGGPAGGDKDYYAANSYRCALLILGGGSRETVRELYFSGEFPQRRAITALLATQDTEMLQELLWAPIPEDELERLLLRKGIGEVVSVLAPDLPVVDAAAGQDLRRWQMQILRATWILRKDRIVLGRRR